MKELISWRTTSGEPVVAGELSLTLQSRALLIRWPPFGGLVWNRPVAVLISRGNQIERIPIVDVTRRAQWGLLGLSLIFAVTGLLFKIIPSFSFSSRRNINERRAKI